MARIAGIDLPKKKRIEFGLTYIYGVGLHTARKVLAEANVDLNKRVYELNDDEIASISRVLRTEKYTIEGDLRKKVAMDIKALMDLGSYRGLRHRKGLPVRGQRTKTNARTRKGKKKTVGVASKA
jgi:small subunit ribosomal protein S13